MNLVVEVRQLLETPEPPELGPGPRQGVRSVREIQERMAGVEGPEPRRALLQAAVLLWHDHLEVAHGIVQDSESADGSYLHAILHRREPDYSNAKYWFRRVGEHRCFRELAARVGAGLVSGNGSTLESRLLPGGRWDAIQFVDLCEAAAHGCGGDGQLLRKIQQAEFEVLIDHLGSR
jgi:hypothetical protein